MKKICLIGLCCLYVNSLYAGDCARELIDLQGFQQKTDNEFLYESESDFVAIKGYECDNDFCANDTTITMFPGHFWEGEKIKETRTYKCVLGATDDRWEVVSNDESGDIVSGKWCDDRTESGEHVRLRSWKEIEKFEEMSYLWEGVDFINRFAAWVEMDCYDGQWINTIVIACDEPYVANDQGMCEYYIDYLNYYFESGNGLSSDEHKQELGLSESEYSDYIKGNINDEDRLKEIFSMDPIFAHKHIMRIK